MVFPGNSQYLEQIFNEKVDFLDHFTFIIIKSIVFVEFFFIFPILKYHFSGQFTMFRKIFNQLVKFLGSLRYYSY